MTEIYSLHSRRSSSSFRIALVALLALILGLFLAPLQSSQAEAANLDAITGVTIVEPVDTVSVGDSMRIEATWAVQNAQQGDTFALTLPTSPRFDGTPMTFPLREPGGSEIGTCVATAVDIQCTLNNYVTTHPDISGSLYFFATAAEESSESDVTFKTNGRDIIVPVPGGKIGPEEPQSWFADPFKDGVIRYADWSIEYSVYIPGQIALQQPSPIVVSDKYDPRLGPLTRDPRVYYVSEAQWTSPNPWGYDQYLDTSEFSWTDDGSGNLEVTIDPAAIDPDLLYIVKYRLALPWDAREGDTYVNTASGSNWSVSNSTVYREAGGGGTGNSVRSVSLTKQVSGENPGSGPFTFELSCVDASSVSVAGYPQTQSLGAGETIGFTRIPVGSTCTFTETNRGGADSVSYSQNPIVITDQSPALVAVTATNNFVTPASETGAIAITKQVQGTAAAKVPADMKFSVKYTYPSAEGGEVSGTVTVTKGSRTLIEDLPIGAVVTLQETIPASELSWDPAVFSINGVTSTGEAQVTVSEGTVIEVLLNNTANESKPKEPVGPDGKKATVAPQPNSSSGNGTLATTGSSLQELGGWSALLLAIGGIAVAIAAKRRRVRP